MASGFQEFLDKYGGDKKITGSEIRDFGDSGGSQQKAENYLEKIQKQQDKEKKAAAGVQIGDKAFTAVGKEKNFGGSTGGGISVDPADNASAGGTSGYSGTDIDLGAYEEMARIDTANQDFLNQGLYNSEQLIANIRAEADVAVANAYSGASMYSADAYAGAQMYGADRQKEYMMYGADQDRLARENVASIQGEYSLDLQEIVNAGAKDVETIRGEYGLEGEKLRGEYGLEMERLRGDTARDVAQRQKEGQIFGSMMSGFWA
jgi:hypothetical protein